MIGRISAIDYAKGCADVVFTEEEETIRTGLPFLAHEYKMPEINDLVLVALEQYDRKIKGYIIGLYYGKENLPEVSGKDVYFKRLSDESYIQYKDGEMKIQFADDAYIRHSGSTMTIQFAEDAYIKYSGGTMTIHAQNVVTSEG